MMLKILIPTDFSDNAYHALRYAVFLFEKKEATFYILNTYQAGPSYLENRRTVEQNAELLKISKEASEQDLSKILMDITSENNNSKHKFKTISASGVLENVIGKAATDNDIHYIFMGTQGATGLKGVFLGSNTARIISKIDFCPIVAVPANYNFGVPTEILFATGFEHMFQKYELNPMLVLAKLWGSKIRILHLLDKNEGKAHKKTAKKVLTQRLKEIPFELMEIEKKGKISVEIDKVLSQNSEMGMVAIINYWHSFIEKLTRESVVKNMAFHSKVPLLVMHLID